MREIDFRVWDTKREEMCYDVTIFANGWTGCVFKNGDEWSYHPNAEIIRMQYTGLKEKNGKKIFEGDILRFPSTDFRDERDFIGYEVFFHDNDCADKHIGFQMNRMHFYGSLCGGECMAYMLPKYTTRMEVYGNIYENPPLK